MAKFTRSELAVDKALSAASSRREKCLEKQETLVHIHAE